MNFLCDINEYSSVLIKRIPGHREKESIIFRDLELLGDCVKLNNITILGKYIRYRT